MGGAIGSAVRSRRPHHDERVVVLHLPYVTARLEMAPPPKDDGRHLGPVPIPSAKMTAYYIGLGTLAAVEAIEWPIAAALAVGSYVAQRTRATATAPR
ncbi:hypothetical protein FrEUN1fDRAFT_0300 [Parafrankia sp. EUN1f]|nr:hypothetical protein FrEUN1fDRAFT_0300 [Parafrankia sp. EUN1f]